MRASTNRRGFLRAVGASALVGLTGCSAITGGDGGEQAPLIVTHDMVIGAGTTRENQAPCSLTNQFLRGQRVIFRVDVVNPDTGETMTGEGLSRVAVEITSGGGATAEAAYGPHPPDDPTDEYWVAAWPIPTDFPPGPVDYGIVVENGRPTRSVTFDVPPSNLTVLEGTYQGGQ